MQHHDAVIGEKFGAAPKIGLVEIDADMLEHADRHDAVERSRNVTIVLEEEFCRSRQVPLDGAVVGDCNCSVDSVTPVTVAPHISAK